MHLTLFKTYSALDTKLLVDSRARAMRFCCVERIIYELPIEPMRTASQATNTNTTTPCKKLLSRGIMRISSFFWSGNHLWWETTYDRQWD